MEYDDSSLQPNRHAEVEVDSFIDWYATNLGTFALLRNRPDRGWDRGIDGVYDLGNLRVAVEHTSFDEMPHKRKHDAAYRKLQQEFERLTVRRADCVYTISVPYGVPTHKDARNQGQGLADWFLRHGPGLSPDKVHLPQDAPFKVVISVRRSDRYGGRVWWMWKGGGWLLKRDLRSRIRTALDAKLPKLLQHHEPDAIKVLVLQNDEVSRGFVSDYAPFVRGYLHRHLSAAPDEIWGYEHLGEHQDCALLWSSVLDKTNGPPPYDSNSSSLLHAYLLRRMTWQRSRLLAVGDSGARREVMKLLERGMTEGVRCEATAKEVSTLLGVKR